MSGFLFSTIDVTRQVFSQGAQSFAIVNLKPILPGHVLVVPKRVVPRLSDLTASELADLMSSVQRVGNLIERAYKAKGLSIACQDGTAAGQTVPHVHFHLLPRGFAGDPFAGRNDEIYPALERSEGTLSDRLHVHKTKETDPDPRPQPIKMDADENRRPRTLEDMEKEATWLRTFFNQDDEGVSAR